MCGGHIPGILNALEELLADSIAGDPASGMRWTHRSLRALRMGLARRGIKVARATIARLLGDLGFSLRTCRKNKAGIHDIYRAKEDTPPPGAPELLRLYVGEELDFIVLEIGIDELYCATDGRYYIYDCNRLRTFGAEVRQPGMVQRAMEFGDGSNGTGSPIEVGAGRVDQGGR